MVNQIMLSLKQAAKQGLEQRTLDEITAEAERVRGLQKEAEKAKLLEQQAQEYAEKLWSQFPAQVTSAVREGKIVVKLTSQGGFSVRADMPRHWTLLIEKCKEAGLRAWTECHEYTDCNGEIERTNYTTFLIVEITPLL